MPKTAAQIARKRRQNHNRQQRDRRKIAELRALGAKCGNCDGFQDDDSPWCITNSSSFGGIQKTTADGICRDWADSSLNETGETDA